MVTAKKSKDIILLLIFVLYIISSYVCQDALLPPKINSILLLVFVGISIFCFMIRAQSYDLNFSKWYSLYILYALVSAIVMFIVVYMLGNKLHLFWASRASILITFIVTCTCVVLLFTLLSFVVLFNNQERKSILNMFRSLIWKS